VLGAPLAKHARAFSLLASAYLPLVIVARILAGMFKQTQNTCRSIAADVTGDDDHLVRAP